MANLPVALAVMTAGDIRMETSQGINACIATNLISQTFMVQSGPYLDNGRNNMLRVFEDAAVRKNCTHLLMVDSDIGFHPQDVRALFEAMDEPGVLSGIYYSAYDGWPRPVIYDWTVNEAGLKTMEVIKEWEDGWAMWPNPAKEGLEPVVDVQACGAGFMLIHQDVCDDLAKTFGDPQPWFSEPVIDGVHFGEDLAFCLRVKDAGFPVRAHRGVEVAHYKTTILGPMPGSRVVA